MFSFYLSFYLLINNHLFAIITFIKKKMKRIYKDNNIYSNIFEMETTTADEQKKLKTWYINKKIYDAKYKKRNAETLNVYQNAYNKRMRMDKTSDQYKRRLETQRQYYRNVISVKMKEARQMGEKNDIDLI